MARYVAVVTPATDKTGYYGSVWEVAFLGNLIPGTRTQCCGCDGWHRNEAEARRCAEQTARRCNLRHYPGAETETRIIYREPICVDAANAKAPNSPCVDK